MYVFTNHLELSTVIDTLHLLSNKCCRVDWNYQWSLCALHSTCVWAARCLKLNKPLITALNTGVENWASLQPNPRLQVLDTACCVFLFRSLTCADARVHAYECEWPRGKKRVRLCLYASESRPHPLKPALQCVGVWARTHCPSAGWLETLYPTSGLPLMHYSYPSHTNAHFLIFTLISRVGGMVIFIFFFSHHKSWFCKDCCLGFNLIDFNKCDHFYRMGKCLCVSI